MKKGIYAYMKTDKSLKRKILLLHNNLDFADRVERRCIIELAFHLKKKVYKQGALVFQQFQKIDELLFV